MAAMLLALSLVSAGAFERPVGAVESHSGPSPRYGRLAPPTLVRPQGGAAASPHPRLVRPPLPRDGRAQTAAKQAPAAQGRGRRQGLIAPQTGRAGASPAPSAQKLWGFPTMDESTQASLFGDQAVQPPDTQLAAGLTQLVEMDNSLISVWSKSGTRLATDDLNHFFAVSPGLSFTDPRVLYDAQAARWFASGMGFNQSGDSEVYLLVSQTSDASGSWYRYVLASYTGTIADQPKLGVSDDKVVITSINFTGSAFVGSVTHVVQKSAAVNPVTAPAVATFSQNMSLFGIVPSQSLTSTSTQWLVCLKGSGVLAVIAIDGIPGQSTVTWLQSDLHGSPASIPPNAQQPSGPLLDTGDDRLLSAVWRGGVLWTSGNDGCTPGGDSAARSCLRLFQVATSGAGGLPAMMHDFDIAQFGSHLYYPAVTTDRYGNLFAAYSASSSQMYAGAFAVDQLAGSPNALGSAITIQSGQGVYSFDSSPTNPQRWGDYSAAAVDPVNGADVWLSGEYAASTTNPSVWGTATARVAIQPQLTAVTPSTGQVGGGQSVTISGAYFQGGATVSFGAAMASNVVVSSQTQITATTPSGSGAVDVAVVNPDGAWNSAPAAYTYWEFLGGGLSSAPAAASWSPGRLDVFARGGDNGLWHKWYSGGWSDWEPLGGVLSSGPGVVSWAPGRLDVLVQGLDGALWHKWYSAGWSGWESLGGVLTSSPTAASWSAGRLDVFVRGTDNAVWHNWYAAGWGGWESLGGQINGPPSAVSWSPGRLDLFARATNDSLQHSWYAGGWSGWESLDGQLASGPSAASPAGGNLDVFTLGPAGSLQRRGFSAGWGGWHDIGGHWTSDPSAASQRNSSVDLFERGSENGLWHTTLHSPGG
jgi:IPT/TIG domain-containing protein